MFYIARAAALLLLVGLSGCMTIAREVASTPQFQVGYHMSRAMAFYRDRRAEAAREECDLALEAQPNCAPCLEYRAASDIVLHNPTAAIADLNRAEAVLPKTSTPKFREEIISMRVSAEDQAGRYGASASDELRLAHYEPKAWWVREGLAHELFAQGNVAAAIAAEDAAIKLAPRNASLYNNRCFYTTATANFAGALADCDYALRHQQGIPGLRLHTLSSRALVYVKLDRPADAIADCDAALRIATSDPDSLYVRGFAEAQQHDTAAAKRDIAAALAKEPSLTQEYAVFHLR